MYVLYYILVVKCWCLCCLVTIQNRRRQGGNMLQSSFPHNICNWVRNVLRTRELRVLSNVSSRNEMSFPIYQNIFWDSFMIFFAFYWAAQYKGSLAARGDRDCCYQSESVLTFLFSKNADLVLLYSMCIFVHLWSPLASKHWLYLPDGGGRGSGSS